MELRTSGPGVQEWRIEDKKINETCGGDGEIILEREEVQKCWRVTRFSLRRTHCVYNVDLEGKHQRGREIQNTVVSRKQANKQKIKSKGFYCGKQKTGSGCKKKGETLGSRPLTSERKQSSGLAGVKWKPFFDVSRNLSSSG